MNYIILLISDLRLIRVFFCLFSVSTVMSPLVAENTVSLLRMRDGTGGEPEFEYLYQVLDDGNAPNDLAGQQQRREEALIDYYTGRADAALSYFRARSLRGDFVAEMMLAWDQAGKSGNFGAPLEANLKTIETKLSARFRELNTRSLMRPDRLVVGLGEAFVLNPADFIQGSESQAAVMLPQLYFHYMSGVMEEAMAEAATNEATRKAARERAGLHFNTWRRGIELRSSEDDGAGHSYIALDIFHLRGLAIAKERGGRGVERDARESARLWEKLENLGVVEAKNRLGLLHFNRQLGEASSLKYAAQKFGEGLVLGDRHAPYNLAELYALGAEGSPDLKRAREALEVAASRGNDHALLRETLLGERPVTSWSVENEAGDRITATLSSPVAYPAILKTYARGKERPGRVLAFKIRYSIVSVGAARIFPPANRFNFYSPSPVLMDEGEHTVWVAMSEPAKRIEYIDLRMVHGNQEEAILSLRIPVIACWVEDTL